MKRPRKIIAWGMFLGGMIGFITAALRLYAKQEPLIVLLLSWAALWYEGFNAIQITDKES